MEAGEYRLTRGAFFVARGLEVVALVGLLWISWCFLVAAGFSVSVSFFFFVHTRSAASMRPPCLIYLSKSTGVCTGLRYLIICLSVCMCNIRRFY